MVFILRLCGKTRDLSGHFLTSPLHNHFMYDQQTIDDFQDSYMICFSSCLNSFHCLVLSWTNKHGRSIQPSIMNL